MYHYKESGLDNVWLTNGYRIHETEYGAGVSIECVDDLHRAMAASIVDSPNEITGAELRFLRIELDLSQRRLGDLMHSDEQTVRRWEKARTKPIKGPGERMIRVVYKAIVSDKGIKRMVQRLSDLDEIHTRGKIVFKETQKGWQPEERAA
jgi:putative transcriptional regulator